MMEKLSAKRLMPAANGVLVRVYKIVGLAALVGILLGLVSFLSVNLFYLFDNTWMRPVILSPDHERVVDQNARLASINAKRSDLFVERRQLENELAGVERRIEANKEFEAEYERALGAAPANSPEALLARRAYHQAVLERRDAEERKSSILREISVTDEGIQRFDGVINQIEQSPYIEAMERDITVAFVPYENLHNIHEDAAIYGCSLNIVWCSHVGRVIRVLEGEVQNTHPQDGTSARGRMLEIVLTEANAAEERVLFVGKRPLWIF